MARRELPKSIMPNEYFSIFVQLYTSHCMTPYRCAITVFNEIKLFFKPIAIGLIFAYMNRVPLHAFVCRKIIL